MKHIIDTGINMEEFKNNLLNITYIDACYSEFGIPSTTQFIYL